MYTSDELITYAGKQQVKVSTRQIREWTRDGLLPIPTRAALPGQGKAGVPYRYPQSAPAAVVWLGKHRRAIDGVEATKFLMWVDGNAEFDYIQIDKDKFVTDLCQKERTQAKARVRSLPDLDDAHTMTFAQQEAILDEFDENVTKPALRRGEITEESLECATLAAARLGLFHGREEVLAFTPDDGTSKSYEDILFGRQPPNPSDHRVTEEAELMVNVPAFVRDTDDVNVYRMVKGRKIDWNELRRTWTFAKQLFSSSDPLAEIKYDVLTLVRFYCHMRMEQMATFMLMFLEMEEAIQDSPIMPEEVKQAHARARREAVQHVMEHGGFLRTHRPELDTLMQNIIRKYAEEDRP